MSEISNFSSKGGVSVRVIHNISGGLFFIERGWLNANHFVFNGRKKVLIDTGYKSGLDQTLSLIRQVGLNPSDVELIISTHGHCDHIGGNKSIQDLSGCEIAMHPIDRYFIDSENDWYVWWRYFGQDADFFKVTRSLEDEDTFVLDGLELVVIHTPGHAPGMISLFCPQLKFLISADAVWDGDFGVLNTRIEGGISPFLQQKSLERLSRLDVDTIYPGHGGIIRDGRGAIDRCRRRLDSFLKTLTAWGGIWLKKFLSIRC